MKKYIATPLFAVLAAVSVSAADLVVSSDTNVTTTTTYDSILFNTSGVTLNANGGMIYDLGAFTVADGVSATATTGSGNAYYIGTLDTANAGAINGSSAATSALTFTGYIMGARTSASQLLNVNNITLNLQNNGLMSGQNNLLRGQTITFTNSIVNILDGTGSYASKIGTYGSTTTDGVMFVNSQLNVNSGALLTFTAEGGYSTGTSKVVSLSSGSTLTNNGTISMNGFGLRLNASTATINGTSSTAAGALILTNSAVLNLTTNFSATSLSATDSTVTNTSTFTNSGTFTLSNSTFTTAAATSTGAVSLTDSTLNIITSYGAGSGAATINGTNSIKGAGSYTSTGTWTFSSAGSLYVMTSSFSSGAWTSGIDETVVIGADSLGTESAVTATISGIQFNAGRLTLKGGSTLTSNGNFNFAAISGTQSNFASGTSITVNGSSRINNAYIDGTLTVAGGAQMANGWNYSLALGAYSTGTASQKGTVTIGANAQIADNATAVTYFGLYGTITSYAGAGKVTSNANAPLMLYKDTTLTLNSTDAFAVGGAATQAESTFNLYAGANVSLAVNADNNIGAINFRDGTATLVLSIAEGRNLTLGSFTNSVVGGLMAIALGDTLQYGEFKITDMSDTLSNYASQSSLNFTDGASSRVLGTNLFITETSAGSGEYYVYTVAVPEPAEWAAIFGAIALGLALYRRRKS